MRLSPARLRRLPLFPVVLALFALIPFAAGCTGLAGEPRIVASIPPPTPVPTEVGFPVALPDMRLGAALYAEHCTACHGPNGAGNGSLVLSGQVMNPGNFTLPEAARRQRPSEWHATVTNGRIENLMPPWREALSEPERWAVSFYTYTQHYERAALSTGEALYARHCAECHGETGLGDGPEAARISGGVPSLLDLETMSRISDQSIWYGITEGIGEHMPGFADTMTDDERWAVTAYTRSLMLASRDVLGMAKAAEAAAAQQPPAPVSTPDADAGAAVTAAPLPPAEVLGLVTGTITNGTAASTVPADLPVELFVFTADFALVQQLATTADAAGRYSFPVVALDPTGQYIARVTYRERIYTSAITPGSALNAAAQAERGEAALDLPITVYELTEDPAVLVVSGVVTQVSAVEGTGEGAGTLEIAQVFSVTNTGDRAFSTSQTTDDGRPISVAFELPPGALVAGFGENDRFVVAQDQFTILDTVPVLPGEGHIVQVIYLVEYPGDAIIEQAVPYALDGPVRLLVRPLSLTVEGAQFPPLGAEQVGTSEFTSYGGDLTLPAGSTLRFDIRGTGFDPASAATGEPAVAQGNNLPLLIALGVAVEIALVAALYVWYRRRRARRMAGQAQAAAPVPAPAPANDAVAEVLIAELASLDAERAAGRIDEAAYTAQRAALKARLAARLGKRG
jgi:mono/diheme cytochrome c family protein